MLFHLLARKSVRHVAPVCGRHFPLDWRASSWKTRPYLTYLIPGWLLMKFMLFAEWCIHPSVIVAASKILIVFVQKNSKLTNKFDHRAAKARARVSLILKCSNWRYHCTLTTGCTNCIRPLLEYMSLHSDWDLCDSALTCVLVVRSVPHSYGTIEKPSELTISRAAR